MSVETFSPSDSVNISMTDVAVAHTLKQVSKQGAAGIRLAVKKSGCSGFMYVVDYVQQPAADDVEVKVNDALSVFVAADALPMVQGTEIDFVTEGLNHTIRFNNPNVTSECGCGESFTVS